MLAASGKLDRRELTRALLTDRGDMLVIAGLGAPAWDITAIGDCAENLPLWGGMGGAAILTQFGGGRHGSGSVSNE